MGIEYKYAKYTKSYLIQQILGVGLKAFEDQFSNKALSRRT